MSEMVKFPVLVSIMQTIPAWPSGSYELEVMGFGATLARRDLVLVGVPPGQALETADAAIAKLKAPRSHRAAVRFACEACGVSGVEPGFKRKPCGRCGGKGAREVVA